MRGAGLVIAATVAVLAGAALAQDAPLPRPRPAVDAPAATAAWAADAQARFSAARDVSAQADVAPAQGGVAAAPLPRPRPRAADEPEAMSPAPEDFANAPLPELAARLGAPAPPLAEPAAPTAEPSAAGEPAHEPEDTGEPHALAAIDAMAPLPRPRPDKPELALMTPPRINSDLVTMPPDDPGCLDNLRALGVAFSDHAPLDPGGACEVKHPLTVTSFGSGVSVAPETVLNCATTLAMAKWVRDTLVPDAKRILGEAPSGIRQDSAYVCRNRYNDPRQKISEHARANALDIAEIEFDGRDAVAIGRSKDALEARFEAAIRAGSCDEFTTVLGPGSNAAHATHFHFDLAHRRGGYRLCELGAPSEVAAKAKRE